MPFVLASSSPIRRAMLATAGLTFDVVRATIDEAEAKARLADPVVLADELARAKAAQVSATRREQWTVGSDSVISVDGRRFDKPRDIKQAAEHLRAFSGQTMRLTSAVALAQGGVVAWSHADTALLHVRSYSDRFIDDYLEREWPEVGYCVGVFRMEGMGVQLFSAIEGDYFTILGMPLLPLLGALRDRGVIAA